MQQFTPTYLYIKQHSITGKLYFGKTIKNPEKYLGSGKRWVNHYNYHGREHVVNLWYCLFYSKDELTQFALMFSKQQNIVELTDWMNLQNENGIDGNSPDYIVSGETKLKHKELWADPSYREKQSLARAESYANLVRRELNSQRGKQYFISNPKERRRVAAVFKEAHERLGIDYSSDEWVGRSIGSVGSRAKAKETHQSDEHREKCKQRELDI